MRVIKQATLRDFWNRHPRTREPLRAWHNTVTHANWGSMTDVLNTFRKSVPLNADRVRFPILGGSYGLIAAIHFPSRVVWIKFIGTHADCDRIDALSVDQY
jgi:mRNA interferase HigB